VIPNVLGINKLRIKKLSQNTTEMIFIIIYCKILLLTIYFGVLDLDILDFILLGRVTENKKSDWDPEQAKLKMV